MSGDQHAAFHALADPTRRKILEWLDDEDSATATGLAERLPMSRQGVAKHLRELEAAGLISSAKQGRETRYSVAADGLDSVTVWLGERGKAWDDRLARLRDTAADT